MRPGFLASVATLAEIPVAVSGGADIIDLKDPAQGALGAWPRSLIIEAVAGMRCAQQSRRRALSATVGDLPMQVEAVVQAVSETASTGVDYVKIGLFERRGAASCLRALTPIAQRGETKLIAVLFADRDPDLALIDEAAACGFRGVMLDTAHKGSGRLCDHLDADHLRGFVGCARGAGLLVGLAGSLRIADIAPLAGLAPDYLGFRGALCGAVGRTGQLDPSALRAVRNEIDRARTIRSAARPAA